MQEPNLKPTERKRTSPLKTNLILTVVLVLAASFAYWFEFQRKGKPIDSDIKKLIGDVQEKVAEKVSLYDKEKKTDVEFVCKANCKVNDPNAQWEITKPIHFKADEGNVGSFVSSVSQASVLETILVEGDFESRAKDFGLNKEKRQDRMISIKFQGESKPNQIYLGDSSAIGENVYVLLESATGNTSSEIKLVSGFVKTNLQREFTYWRNKKVFDFATSEIEGLKLTNPKGVVALNRKEKDWFFTSGQRADNEVVDTFLTGIVFLNAVKYVSDNKVNDKTKILRGYKPLYALEVLLSKKPKTTLEVYNVYESKDATAAPTPKVYATLSNKNYIIELDRPSTEKFTKKYSDFKQRQLLSQEDQKNVKKFSVTLSAKEKLEFELTNGVTKLISKPFEKFDQEAANSLLEKITSLRIAEFLDTSKIPAGNNELSKWLLTGEKEKTLALFAIYGNPAKGDYYAKLSSGEIAKLERGSASSVPSKLSDFQRKTP